MSDFENISDEVRLRRENLANGLTTNLVQIEEKDGNFLVNSQESFICGVTVEEAGYYRIYDVSEDWSKETSYRCEESGGGTWHYYLETIDEVIGEVKRLVEFKTARKVPANSGQHTSQLSKVVTAQKFKEAYTAFIKQADENVESDRAKGKRTPSGFDKKPECDEADFAVSFGRGRASKTPYMNWHVVSIYYLPDGGDIIIGIEKKRYAHLKEMQIQPSRYARIGDKDDDIAVFYSGNKNTVNYDELYNNFIDVCEEVMRLGLE